MTGTKNPYDNLFWNDLEHDEKLKTCSWSARGFWTCKLLPVAARSIERGVVILGDHPCRWNEDLPTLLAIDAGAGSPDIIETVAASFLAMLTELVKSGAASVDDKGRVYNRRMVRVRELSETRRKAGQTGAAARWQTDSKHHGKPDGKNQRGSADHKVLEKNDKSGQPGVADRCEVDSKPMHSSLFSLQEGTVTTTETEERGATRAKRAPPLSTRKLTAEWTLSDELRQWTDGTLSATNAVGKVDVERELLKFRTYHIREGTTERGATRAWHTWIFNAIKWSEEDGSSISRQGGRQPQRRSPVATAAALAAGLSRLGDRGSGGEGDPQ